MAASPTRALTSDRPWGGRLPRALFSAGEMQAWAFGHWRLRPSAELIGEIHCITQAARRRQWDWRNWRRDVARPACVDECRRIAGAGGVDKYDDLHSAGRFAFHQPLHPGNFKGGRESVAPKVLPGFAHF